jgi:hypothetical protein
MFSRLRGKKKGKDADKNLPIAPSSKDVDEKQDGVKTVPVSQRARPTFLENNSAQKDTLGLHVLDGSDDKKAVVESAIPYFLPAHRP